MKVKAELGKYSGSNCSQRGRKLGRKIASDTGSSRHSHERDRKCLDADGGEPQSDSCASQEHRRLVRWFCVSGGLAEYPRQLAVTRRNLVTILVDCDC